MNSDPLDKFPSIVRNVDGVTYITRDVFRYVVHISEFVRGLYPFTNGNSVSGVTNTFNMSAKDLKGPSINLQCDTILNSKAHGEGTRKIYSRDEIDMVLGFKCAIWPPIAGEWIYRTRQSGWPTDRSIKEIVSEGCHVVAAAHHFSENKDLEFRFSFSLAEVALFQVMSMEQKKCYALFKGIVGRALRIRNKLRNLEVKLKSYHLKTIFLWSCETIPQHAWNTTSGWTRCFLFLIDQLSICLNQQFIPGYFIPQYNLLDTFSSEILNDYATLVHQIRKNPIYYAPELMSKMMLYRGSVNLVKRLHIFLMRVPMDEEYDHRTILGREIRFLQNLLVSFDESGIFWKKSIILQMFATWCLDKPKNESVTSSSEFISKQMSLFDVCYLDIVHELDVPVDILLACAEREASGHLISRLASLYCSNPSTNEISNHNQKASLLSEACLRRGSNSLLYGAHLYSVDDYKTAEGILERVYNSKESDTDFFNQICSTSLFKDQIWVIEEIQISTANDTAIYLSSKVLVCYLLIKCYLKLGRDFNFDKLIVEMKTRCEALNHADKYLNYHLLAVVCSELGRDAISNEAIRATLFWKTQKFAELANDKQGILHTNEQHMHEKVISWSRSLLFFQIFIWTWKAILSSDMNPKSEIYLQLESLLLKFEKFDVESIPISVGVPVGKSNL